MNERFKELRKRLDLTQEEFAGKIGLSRNFIAQVETGVRTPSDRTLSDICRVFNVDLRWLKTGEGEMFAESEPREELARFFGEVLGSAPDERSAFIAALAGLPGEFWPMVAELAREFVERLKAEKKDTEP